MTTTKITGKGEVRVPWGRYSEAIDRAIDANTTPERIEARIREHLANPTATSRVIEGTYRDLGTIAGDNIPGCGGSVRRPTAVLANYTPSDAQIRFLNALLAEREHTYTEAQILEGLADWRKIRLMLDTLKVAPRRQYPVQVQQQAEVAPQRARLNFAEIADGNYAVREDGVVKFYRVSSRNGYKNVQVRASDDLYPVRGRAGIAVLHRIVEAGLEASAMLFATELGRCWRCGKTLTDEESRARGMGPDCAGK